VCRLGLREDKKGKRKGLKGKEGRKERSKRREDVLSTRSIDIIVAFQDDRTATRGAGDAVCVDLLHKC
jgi:hypothetical protein